MRLEKIVIGATKPKLDPPKAKYIEPILGYTNSPNDLDIILALIRERVNSVSWMVSYKCLVVIHIMFREGAKDRTISQIRKVLSIFSGDNNNDYGRYLKERVLKYHQTRIDYVRDKTRLRKLTVETGLITECMNVMDIIDRLLRNSFSDIENDIILTSYRYLIRDLLTLYQSLNEGLITILGNYFDLNKSDAEEALKIYKRFTLQTASVVKFLRKAKDRQHITKLKVPNIKHAPIELTESLEGYLKEFDAKPLENNDSQLQAQAQAQAPNVIDDTNPFKQLVNQSLSSVGPLTAQPTGNIPLYQLGSATGSGIQIHVQPTVHVTGNPFQSALSQQTPPVPNISDYHTQIQAPITQNNPFAGMISSQSQQPTTPQAQQLGQFQNSMQPSIQYSAPSTQPQATGNFFQPVPQQLQSMATGAGFGNAASSAPSTSQISSFTTENNPFFNSRQVTQLPSSQPPNMVFYNQPQSSFASTTAFSNNQNGGQTLTPQMTSNSNPFQQSFQYQQPVHSFSQSTGF